MTQQHPSFARIACRTSCRHSWPSESSTLRIEFSSLDRCCSFGSQRWHLWSSYPWTMATGDDFRDRMSKSWEASCTSSYPRSTSCCRRRRSNQWTQNGRNCRYRNRGFRLIVRATLLTWSSFCGAPRHRQPFSVNPVRSKSNGSRC